MVKRGLKEILGSLSPLLSWAGGQEVATAVAHAVNDLLPRSWNSHDSLVQREAALPIADCQDC